MKGQVQQLVCTDDELARLDRQLSDAYGTALKTLPPDDVPMVKAAQRGWKVRRDDRCRADDTKKCALAHRGVHPHE